MDVFYHNLEAVEAAGFRCCYFGDKVGAQVLVYNDIRGREERKNMRDEVTFVVR